MREVIADFSLFGRRTKKMWVRIFDVSDDRRSDNRCSTVFRRIFSPVALRPMRAMESSFLRLLDYTQRHNTVGRAPLEGRPVRRREVYLTVHNTRNRRTSNSRRDSNTQSQQASSRRPEPQTARPLVPAIGENST